MFYRNFLKLNAFQNHFLFELAKTKTNQILDMHMCLNYFGIISSVYNLNWPLEKMTGILILSISVYQNDTMYLSQTELDYVDL